MTTFRPSALALLALLALPVAGCDAEDPTTGDEQNQTELNGKSPQDYYRQFLYVKKGHLDHHYPSTWDMGSIEGTDVRVSLSLYMRADGSYTADYAEWKQIDSVKSEQTGEIEALAGRWSIVGSELHLDTLGVATATRINGQDALSLTFDRDLVTAGLDGEEVELQMVKSSWGPDGND